MEGKVDSYLYSLYGKASMAEVLAQLNKQQSGEEEGNSNELQNFFQSIVVNGNSGNG